jgi:hypothetical protein
MDAYTEGRSAFHSNISVREEVSDAICPESLWVFRNLSVHSRLDRLPFEECHHPFMSTAESPSPTTPFKTRS